MPKKTRRIITILFLIIILFTILYCFNIFNIKNAIHGISVSKITNGNTTITTTIGKSLDLPKDFLEHNISIQDNDKIVTIVVTETKKENISSKTTEITLTTQKTIEEIFEYYKSKFSNPITTKLENSAVIIGGDAQNLVKVNIESGKYRITMEKR